MLLSRMHAPLARISLTATLTHSATQDPAPRCTLAPLSPTQELAGGPCGVPWPRRCRLLGVMHGDGRDCTARTAGGALSGSLCPVGGGRGGGMKRAEPGKVVQQDRTKAAALPTRGGGREARQGAGAGLRRGGGGGGRQAAGLGSLRQCEHGHNNG